MYQKPLPLLHNADYSADKWLISSCNELATKWVFSRKNINRDENNNIACICGPAGSGKTHIANIFANISDGVFLSLKDVQKAPHLVFQQYKSFSSFVIEDFENYEERWLFGMFNVFKSNGTAALFTTRVPLNFWKFRLKDLDSRLKSTTIINIDNPDDELLSSVIIKLLKDEGISVDSSTVDYLIKHIPRSFGDAAHWVKVLNKTSLIYGRKISKPLVRHLIRDFEDSNFDDSAQSEEIL